MLTTGSKFSHYQILEKIGQGGMGEVYLAEDVNLRRRVALKVLAPKYSADPGFQARFKLEAQAAANLSHPNIITIYEIGEHENCAFIAMEYVQGESLRDRLIREKLTSRQVIDFVLQICDGLSEAHRAGIVHRDLKPANILINRDGRVKIVDFGLAKVQGVSKLTKTGIMMGTLPYMSPEQVRGEKLDQRSDIFSMGVVLYELLSRDLPFQGDSEYAVMSSIVDREPRPLAAYNPDVPESLQNIINTALAKDLKKRYQQIDELAQALKNLGEIETTFKNYRLLRKLGAGGMGEVYLAEDMKLRRKVALKFLSEQYTANPEFKARLEREAQLTANLNHPNIVTIYEVGEHQNRQYIAMEYVEGESLKERMTRGKLPLKEAIDLVAQICAGLGKAHRATVVHRDIKPGNILFNLDGQVKIVDFGLAKMPGVSKLTKGGAMMGTIPYMSPEQVKTEEIDQRSDIFSTGVVLYELLTGELPFKGESEFTVMTAITTKEPEALARYEFDLPDALQSCIDKALAKDRQTRYQRIDELQADLKRAMTRPEVIETTEIVPKKKKKTFINRRTAFAGAAILALIALALLFMTKGKEQTKAQLSISQPMGATVFLNDDSLGVTPLNVPLAQEGRIKLRFRKRDYFTFDTSLVIQKGETYKLLPTLEPAARAAIFVEPPEAEVRIDGTLIAASRLPNLQLPVGRYRLSIALAGYDSKEEQFSLQQGDNAPRRYVLTKSPAGALPVKPGGAVVSPPVAAGRLSVRSDPEGATVILDGKAVGTTRYENNEAPPGRHEIVLRKPGYRDDSRAIDIEPQKLLELNVSLTALIGRLSILVKPFGSIYIDDVLERRFWNVRHFKDVPAGTHRLKAFHPQLGTWEKEVSVEPDKETYVEVDFNKQVALPVTSFDEEGVATWAYIFVDGKPTNQITPKRLTLPLGLHAIEVRREGFQVLEGPKTLLLENNVSEPLRFTLRKNP